MDKHIAEIRERSNEALAYEGGTVARDHISVKDIPYLLELIESLQAQLTESQHREQAAVEDLRKTVIFSNSCSFCIHGRNHSFCPNGDKEKCWQWRGPQK